MDQETEGVVDDKVYIPTYDEGIEQSCIICMDDDAKVIESKCCGAGAICYPCLRRGYLNKVACMLCRKDTGCTFIENREVWDKSKLDFWVVIQHSGPIYKAYLAKIGKEAGVRWLVALLLFFCIILSPIGLLVMDIFTITWGLVILIGQLFFMLNLDHEQNWGQRYL